MCAHWKNERKRHVKWLKIDKTQKYTKTLLLFEEKEEGEKHKAGAGVPHGLGEQLPF